MTQEEKAAVELVRGLIRTPGTIRLNGQSLRTINEDLHVLLALIDLEQWQPIETAPKDKVLLYFPEIVKGSFGQSRLAAMMKVGRVVDFPSRQPTHWRPLPQPPEAR